MVQKITLLSFFVTKLGPSTKPDVLAVPAPGSRQAQERRCGDVCCARRVVTHDARTTNYSGPNSRSIERARTQSSRPVPPSAVTRRTVALSALSA